MKWYCTVCGYVYEGPTPEFCPQCKAPASKFKEVVREWARLLQQFTRLA